MMSFYEYAWRKKAALPDAETMLAMAGIDPHGPHEIEVMRLTKQMKKAAAQAPGKAGARIALSRRLPGS